MLIAASQQQQIGLIYASLTVSSGASCDKMPPISSLLPIYLISKAKQMQKRLLCIRIGPASTPPAPHTYYSGMNPPPIQLFRRRSFACDVWLWHSPDVGCKNNPRMGNGPHWAGRPVRGPGLTRLRFRRRSFSSPLGAHHRFYSSSLIFFVESTAGIIESQPLRAENCRLSALLLPASQL